MPASRNLIFSFVVFTLFICAVSVCRAAGPDAKFSVGYKVIDFKYEIKK